jgi:superfamily II DNA or RNA helicase
MNKLRSLRYEDLDDLAEPEVVARGRECVRWGLISDLSEAQGGIEALVAERRGLACEVVVREGSRGLVTACTCPANLDHGEVCKHIVAALVAWIARRDGGAETIDSAAPLPGGESARQPINNLRSLIRLVKGGAAPAPVLDPGQRAEAAGLLAALLPSGVPIRVQVDRGGHTHGLIVSFHRDDDAAEALPRHPGVEGDGPAVSLTIPPGDVAAALRELDVLDGVQWKESASSLRVYYSPVRMRLRADYAREGVLVLSPIAQVRERGGDVRIIEPIHLHEGLDGTVWVEDGADTMRRVGLWTSLIDQYAPDFKPRVLEGNEVVDFLTFGQETKWRGGLDPSDRVRRSQVLNDVKLARVEVSEAPEGWLWLDPVYHAGEHSLALTEILEAQRSGGLLRRGDDWIIIRTGAGWTRGGRPKVEGRPEDDLMGITFPGNAQLDEGRIRAPRLAYLRQRAEWGPDVEVRSDRALTRFEKFLRREGAGPRAPKIRGMIGKLRPYQTAGYRWLWFLRESGLGGILADEMGLGKTHQVMALLLAVYGGEDDGEKAPEPSLVVCPRSVLDHWETKIQEHAPSLEPLVYHGTEREHARPRLHRQKVLLTTYGVLARDTEFLATIRWESVILDEAQYIKNAATKAARAARKLQAAHRVALSGTPLENHVEELRSITDFVLPGYLGTAEWFRRRFARPIDEGDTRALEVLKRSLDPFKLRRLKSQVLTDLPPKIDDVRHATLTPHQAVLYREILSRARASGLLDKLKDPAARVDYIHIFTILSQLKRLCDHPSLVVEGKGARNLTSGKFEAFKELMAQALDEGEKVVVFSQYLEMLDIIEKYLDGLGVDYSGLRGTTRRRGAAIRTFQRDEKCRVFVASLLAGGLGVDLTAASVVIHYDRWWNAAREDQATDRVHRIGQSRGVQVFRIITRGTLEERINGIINEKRRLANRLLETDPAMGLKLLSREDLLDILEPPEVAPERQRH